MADIQAQIKSVIQKRKEQLPLIEVSIQQAQNLEETLDELNSALIELAKHPKATDDLRAYLRDFQQYPFNQSIANSNFQLTNAKTRLLRETINIGVSGQARVGKSTLLQTITGLTDDQIPTGSGIPVTAVRCRIRHSKTHSRATLTLHTFETFRDQILEPYHKVLNLLSCPVTLNDFQAFNYEESILGDNPPTSSMGLLQRLRKMQIALPSYSADLTGGTREVALTALRLWVAYPTNEEENDAKDNNAYCPLRYLAVQDVLIECPFQAADVDDLMLIDLPGLGELDANAEKHHVQGLKNEVDLVLLIKRPVEGLAFWKGEDGKAADILDEARGAIKQRRDFVMIVVNGDPKSQLFNILLDDINRQANAGIPDQNYRVLKCNSIDLSSVRSSLLTPCLQHLAERLIGMDREVIEAAKNEWLTTIQHIEGAIKDLKNGLITQISSLPTSLEEEFEELVETLRNSLSVSITDDVIQKLKPKIIKEIEEDQQLIETIDHIHSEIKKWIENGFGKEKSWNARAYAMFRTVQGSGDFLDSEFNRIRVSISEKYCQIDGYFDTLVQSLWTDINSVICKYTGQLLNGTQNAKESLERFAELLKDASEQCPQLQKSVEELLSLNISYRVHFHPRVREKLDPLNTNELGSYLDRKLDKDFSSEELESYVEELFKRISELTVKASYETRKALLSETSLIPTLILRAAAEQFADSLIRSEESLKEFKRLGRSYRDEIWADKFQNIDVQNASVGRVNRAIDSLETILKNSN